MVMKHKNGELNVATAILLLTALAAGVVDVISFSRLGGIFTSAMTGNLALLGYYAASGAIHSAIKSLSALAGFIVGCGVGALQSRNKPDRSAVKTILALEALILAVCAFGSMQPLVSGSQDLMEGEILLLGFAMGLQSIVGTRLKQTNVVFTSTLIKIVTTPFGTRPNEGKANTIKRETSVVVAYLVGAMIAGISVATRFAGALLIPLAALGIALVCAHRGKS
jgi:uncharacterized membrane protein YoaK (UPF0700 family)